MRKILFLFIFILSCLFVPAQKHDTIDFSQYIKDVDLSKINTTYSPFGYVPIDSITIEKAEKGDADSQYKYGIYLRAKETRFLYTHDECKYAIEWFEKAALQGHKEASVEAGIIYYERWRATWFDQGAWLRRQAISYLKNGGAENDPNLMLYFAELNLCYLDIQGHTKGSGKEALMWCNKAINMGLPLKREEPKHKWFPNHTLSDAYYIMADIYRFQTIDTPVDLEKYFANLELAVKYSDVNHYINGLARLHLGECYYLGLGVKQDQEKANEIWTSLIKDDKLYENDIQKIKDEHLGNKKDINQYKLETEEDVLRKYLKR